jgi:UDP-galactopyranose mutase
VTDFDLVVAGAGPFGLTVARVLAERGRRVAVVERRDHVGGNAYSSPDPETGIEVHHYGAHIFHTSKDRVWDFLSRFTEWTGYTHRVFTTHAGTVYPLPVNLATINQFFSLALSPGEARALIGEQAAAAGTSSPAAVDDVAQTASSTGSAPPTAAAPTEAGPSLEDKAVRAIGRPLYEAFIRDYTAKQWQTPPQLLPGSVIGRLPVRYNYDSRYFSDPHQGLPKDGYGALWERLAEHPNIEVRLGEDFLTGSGPFTKAASAGRTPVLFTGALDQYFDYSEGVLGWRTCDFEWERPQVDDFQGCPVMNYADLDVPWTRIIEFKHFHPEREHAEGRTVIAREFSRPAGPGDEPYYPIRTPADRTRLEAYRRLAESEELVTFGGRLGRYQYLDMDAAVAAALSLADRM